MSQWNKATRLVHAGRPVFKGETAPVNAPIVRTSTMRFRSTGDMADVLRRRECGDTISSYGRQGTDTHRALEAALCEMEGGCRTLLTPSGLSAISLTLLSLLGAGDHLLVTDSVYQAVRRVDGLLRRMGIEVSYFDPLTEPLERHLRPNTRAVYAECPGSYLYEMVDLRALAKPVRERGIPLVADNTWASGLLMNPLALGASVSILACTKYIAGHSDLLQGAVVLGDPALAARFDLTYDAMGLSVNADDTYLCLRGLHTLGVRMVQHARNALEIARELQAWRHVRRVYYPPLPEHPGHALWQRDFSGANGLLSVEFADFSMRQIDAVADHLELFAIGTSWGGFESLVLPTPADKLTCHGSWNGQGGIVRLHIGLEHPGDLLADLRQAIDRAAALRGGTA